MHELIQLNRQFGEAEKQHQTAFFERFLHDKLLFRRAKGGVVGKVEFLDSLKSPANDTKSLSSYAVEVTESEDDSSAVVSLLVQLEGKRGGEEVAGVFRNLRLFVKEPGKHWECLVWFNTRVSQTHESKASLQLPLQ